MPVRNGQTFHMRDVNQSFPTFRKAGAHILISFVRGREDGGTRPWTNTTVTGIEDMV